MRFLKRLWRLLTRRLKPHGPCTHHELNPFTDITVKQVCLGATLSWAGTAVPYFRWAHKCKVCGRKWRSEGYVPKHVLKGVGDYEKYYPNGATWPVDPSTGKPLPIHEF